MVGTVLIITVLNCFFMFSTTVSTCALWWHNKRYRCRNCGRQHTKDKEVNGSDKKKNKNKKKKGMNTKSNEEFDKYVQCPNPNHCYGNDEGSFEPSHLSCIGNQQSFQRDSEVKGILHQQGDAAVVDNNGPGIQPSITAPDTSNDVHNIKEDKAIEPKNTQPDNTNSQKIKQHRNSQIKGDTAPINETTGQSVQRISSEKPSIFNSKSTAAIKQSRNLKTTQCTNNYSNSSWSRDAGRYRTTNMKNGMKCCGQA